METIKTLRELLDEIPVITEIAKDLPPYYKNYVNEKIKELHTYLENAHNKEMEDLENINPDSENTIMENFFGQVIKTETYNKTPNFLDELAENYAKKKKI